MKIIYLDHAATTACDPRVVEAMVPYLNKHFGNPSSLYSLGREAKQAIEDSRAEVASAIGARPEEIVFTSGGTEADNFALEGVAFASQERGNHIITTLIEHHAVLETCKFLEKRGFRITYLPVDRCGFVSPQLVTRAIDDKTILVSVMHANNEVGTIEPIAEIAKVVKGKGIYFHTDAVQTVGVLPINVDELGVDLLSASAHKFYGPKGVGFLYIRKGTKMVSFMHGGEQERRRRASTENVAGIVGLAKALQIAHLEMKERNERITALCDKLIKGILGQIDEVRLNGHPTKRLPNNVNICVEKIEGESMLLNLDAKGVCASTGSACSSSTLEPSHVLLAMGIPPEVAHSSLRLTLGKENTSQEIDYALENLVEIVKRLRSISPLYEEKEVTDSVD